MRTLHQKWLCDKSSALGAAILAGTDIDAVYPDVWVRLEYATRTLAANVTEEQVETLTDSTLSLLDKVPGTYGSPDPYRLPRAMALANALAAARLEASTSKRRHEAST